MPSPENIDQVYGNNPITVNAATDLIYIGQSPFGVNNDAAIQFSDFAAQFGGPYTPAALTRTNDTNVTLTLGGTPATALLHAISLTLGWTGLLGLARGGVDADLSATGGAHQVLRQSSSGAAITVSQLVISDITNGLSNALTSADFFVGNGSNIATGVPMSGDATLSNTGAVTVNTTNGNAIAIKTAIQNQSYVSAVAGGTANAITLTLTPAIAGYLDLQYICFKAAHNNTGPTTINVNGVGPIPLVTNGNNALVGGEILINGDYIAIANTTYTAYVLINSSLSGSGISTLAGNAGSATGSTVTISGGATGFTFSGSGATLTMLGSGGSGTSLGLTTALSRGYY
jgi:hypothetical protein